MIQSNKSNLALRRGRDHLFDRDTAGLKRNRSEKRKALPAQPHVRRKFQEKLRKELRREQQLMWGMMIAVAALAGAAAYFLYV